MIGTPAVSLEKMELHDRYHHSQSEIKGWSVHPARDADSFSETFVENPFPSQEWCYYLDDQLIGVGYVDQVPNALSAIYFFYEPEAKKRSLGTFNVLSIIEQARRRSLSYVYLGYYVEGCQSLAYKAHFTPNEVMTEAGHWCRFRD